MVRFKQRINRARYWLAQTRIAMERIEETSEGWSDLRLRIVLVNDLLVEMGILLDEREKRHGLAKAGLDVETKE